MSADNKARHTWLVLQQLNEDSILSGNEEYSQHIVKREGGNFPSVEDHVSILIQLQQMGAIKTDGY